jgi:predicted  nucleic acid-binding Zn-ribbon protein
VEEKTDVAKAVATLEADLKRVKRDAEAFGRDLKLLRSEKERLEIRHKEEAERARKQSQAQVRLLSEQLEDRRDKAKKAEEALEGHVCAMYVPDGSPRFITEFTKAIAEMINT